jgi:hypothetical protein
VWPLREQQQEKKVKEDVRKYDIFQFGQGER